MDANQKLLAESGWYRLSGTDPNTIISHYGFMPTEDTVIDEWVVTGSDDVEHDLVAYFNISGLTITTDFPALIVPEGFRNSITHSITLTSGAGVLLREG